MSPLQKLCRSFESKVENRDAKTRLQKDTAKDTRTKLQTKQNQHQNFSLLNHKWSWQGQAADIFNEIPDNLKETGRTTSWSQIKAAGKAVLNKTATPKAKIRKHYKLNHKTQADASTGNSRLKGIFLATGGVLWKYICRLMWFRSPKCCF